MNRRHLMLGAAGALAAPALRGAAPALAQAAPTAALAPPLGLAQGTPTSPGFHHVTVGGLRATIVSDGAAVRPDVTQGFIPNASPEQVTAALRAGGVAEGTALANPYNVTFIRTPQGLVALDIGTGSSPAMLTNMRAAGLDPADVVLIAHTHFHGDHIGGLLNADGSPAFPNAAITVPEGEWAFWNDEGEESRASAMRKPGFANVRRRFAPYAARVTRFAPGAAVAPGITSIPSFGHSPGHVSFLVADGGQQLLVLGDVVTTPMFFVVNPEWYPNLDMDPATSVATRKRVLDQAATDRLAVVGYHFPMPATGRIERAGSGYRLLPANA